MSVTQKSVVSTRANPIKQYNTTHNSVQRKVTTWTHNRTRPIMWLTLHSILQNIVIVLRPPIIGCHLTAVDLAYSACLPSADNEWVRYPHPLIYYSEAVPVLCSKCVLLTAAIYTAYTKYMLCSMSNKHRISFVYSLNLTWVLCFQVFKNSTQ
jgi:hypothetical protein